MDKRFSVVANGVKSDWAPVVSGVTQGIFLAPCCMNNMYLYNVYSFSNKYCLNQS